MSREELIQKTINKLNKLPNQKVQEVSEYAEFLLQRLESQLLTEGIQKMASESKTYSFLEDEPELYKVSDVRH